MNLAISLARMNLKVGILDADIFGPSIPSLLPVVDPFVAKCPENPKMVLPISSYGLKMLSFGHVNPKSGAAGAVSIMVMIVLLHYIATLILACVLFM